MTEAYAVLVYSDGPLACAAAVLGASLRRHDPARARVAIVRDLSLSTRQILTHDGLWTLHDAADSKHERKYIKALKRKNELWRLTQYSRVLYLDADSFLLPDAAGKPGVRGARLQRLWSQYQLTGSVKLAATGVRPNYYNESTTRANTCFNGGLLLLRPDVATADALDAIDAHKLRMRGEERRRCPGYDQPLLNNHFREWQRIGYTYIRSITHWLATPAFPRTCGLSTREALLQAADAYHFFHKAWPWENTYCDLCVTSGHRCKSVVPIHDECAVQSIANQLWWQELRQALLPNGTAKCLKLTEQETAASVPAAVAAKPLTRAKLRGAMCTGCANRPTMACLP